MLFGRFLMIVPIMALAGSLVQKKVAPPSVGTFPVSGGTFLILLLGTVLLDRRAELSARADSRARSSSTSSLQGGKLFLTHRTPNVRYDAKTSISFRLEHCWSGHRRLVQKAEPAADGEEPGHVCHHGRRGADDRRNFHAPSRTARLRDATGDLALVHGALCQFCRSGRGRPRQSASRQPAQGAQGHDRAASVATDAKSKSPRPQLQKGDLVVCEAGDIIPADGDVVEGIASVDEAAITGESAPVIRESGGDRSAVTGGTRVLSDRIVIRVTADKGAGFLDRMIALVEGARRQKTPNEIALTILLAALTFIFLLVCVTLKPFGIYSATNFSVPVLIALLVCLIPDNDRRLAQRHRHRGMDRVLQRNVLAMSGRAVEAAGDVDVLLLDKTGTITLGNRMAVALSSRARRFARTIWRRLRN